MPHALLRDAEDARVTLKV